MSLTCSTHRALTRRYGQESEYWQTPAGTIRRVDSLSQNFTYRIVNEAFKIVAPTNGARWLRWLDMGDNRVCDECLRHSSGGRAGFYRVTWFMPDVPVHSGCRCQWEIFFEDPFEQTRL